MSFSRSHFVPAADLLLLLIASYQGDFPPPAAFLGGITVTGSLLAFAKLQGLIGGRPWSLPGRALINGGLMAANAASNSWP